MWERDRVNGWKEQVAPSIAASDWLCQSGSSSFRAGHSRLLSVVMLGAWERLTGQTHAQAKEVEVTLAGLYADPCRKYHNLSHVTDCLRELQELRSAIPSLLQPWHVDEITTAVWFHDAVYDPKAPDNEEESARLFEQLSQGMHPAPRERIRGMILATKLHRPSPSPSPSPSRSLLQEHVMLDLDLSILGKSQSAFDEYDRAIRMEYEWVPEPVYREKRAAVLRDFLGRDRIFFMDYFHDKYDSASRSNLERAISRLGMQ